MVMLRLLALFLITSASLLGEIKVSVDLEQTLIPANQPLRGTIAVTHEESEKIDPATFMVGKAALPVEVVREVQLGGTPPLLLTIYRFQTDGRASGLYVLPPVSVSVNGKIYKSSMTSYEVQAGANGSPAPVTTPTPRPTPSPAGVIQSGKGQPSIRLEAYIEGKSTILPGERTRLAYRVIYSGNIELHEEVLPLLKPDGLRKIGDIDTQEMQLSEASELVISQLVEGVAPGTFSFGPSYIAGAPYQEDASGRKTYGASMIRAEAPAVTVVVAPFPKQDKPASFNGAVGPLKMDVTLQSPAKVNVGDKITLAITLSGDTILENVLPPDVCCQPGFSGLFKSSDLPPLSTIKGNAKTFIVDLWPLSPEIKAIPSIEYTYFDPKTSGYVLLKSQEIPLTVLPAIKPEKESVLETTATAPIKEPEPIKARPIEIQGIFPLACQDLHNAWFGTWDVFALIPLGAVLLLMQCAWRDAILLQRSRVPVKTSEDLLQEAQAQVDHPKLFFPLLNQTLITWLKEQKAIKSSDMYPESLPTTGLAGEVRAFMLRIQEQRFTGQEDLPRQALLDQAKALMRGEKLNGREGS